MARYRLLNYDFQCEDDHKFSVSARYEYTEKTTEYQVRFSNADLRVGTWNDPWTKFPVCPECGKVTVTAPLQDGKPRTLANVQVPDSEASAVGIHPVTGDITYCFDKPGQPLPAHWAELGYQKVTFNHYKDLERFCRQTGQVNDIEGDWAHDEGFFEEDLARRQKAEKEQVERYMDERAKVLAAYPELKRQGQ